MKKITIIGLLAISTTALSHDFLTEILVYNEDYDSNHYEVAVNYDLNEQDILSALKLKKTKFEMSKLVKKSNVRDREREYRHVGDTTHEFETESLQKTCGVFDHFSAARSVAIDMCDAHALANPAQYPQGLIPQFIGPATFTDGETATEDHHELYRYVDGLEFNCVEVVAQKVTYSK